MFAEQEKKDLVINEEKKKKIHQIAKTQKHIEDLKQKKIDITEKCNQIEAENP